jgi:molybdate transport system substrate-binding protein
MGIKERVNVLAICIAVFFLPLPSNAGEISLSIATSLKDAVTGLSEAFEKTHPGITFRMNSGASGALAKQIENGAPADVFFSANLEWIDYLKEKGFVEGGSVGILAYNTLVFVGRPERNIKTLRDILLLERIAIASPKSAPAGEYAMAALSNSGLDKQLEKRLVIAKDVRECLMYAERGEVDGAFVYGSDVKMSLEKTVVLFTVPQDLYPRVTYPMGLTVRGAGNNDAREFLKFLKSKEALAILTKYGFILE